MIHIIILAGGKGVRMRSDIPKVLTPVGGRPMISWILDAVRPLCPRPTVVVGYGAELVKNALGSGCDYAFQKEQLGTGDAVRAAGLELKGRPDITDVLVLNGDHPLTTTGLLRTLVATHETNKPTITMATVRVPNFLNDYMVFERYGRVIRGSDGAVARIVEWKDASPAERVMTEVNPNLYCFQVSWLWPALAQLTNTNQAGEYYLTDLVGLAAAEGRRVEAAPVGNPIETMGANTPEELAIIERYIPHGA